MELVRDPEALVSFGELRTMLRAALEQTDRALHAVRDNNPIAIDVRVDPAVAQMRIRRDVAVWGVLGVALHLLNRLASTEHERGLIVSIGPHSRGLQVIAELADPSHMMTRSHLQILSNVLDEWASLGRRGTLLESVQELVLPYAGQVLEQGEPPARVVIVLPMHDSEKALDGARTIEEEVETMRRTDDDL
jgi:hypothetical protein